MCRCTTNPPAPSSRSRALSRALSEEANVATPKALLPNAEWHVETSPINGRCSFCGLSQKAEESTSKAPKAEAETASNSKRIAKTKKQVRFAPATSTCECQEVMTEIVGPLLVPSSEMSPLEKGEIWWQPSDYDIFKGTARLISGEIRRRESASSRGAHSATYGNTLTRAFKICCDEAGSPSGDSVEFHQHPLNELDYAHLTHWVRVGHSRRGLERWSIAEMGTERQRRKDHALAGLLMEQKRTQKTQDLRVAYEQYTRPARLFALALGQADAAAARAFYATETASTTASNSASPCPVHKQTNRPAPYSPAAKPPIESTKISTRKNGHGAASSVGACDTHVLAVPNILAKVAVVFE